MSKRSVFEEVGAARPAATPATRPPARAPWRRGIALWLWLLAALVAVMVLVGGLTRLTDSGLSITVWDPVMGALPPLSDADWQAAFEAYKATTEFQVQNHWMTLEDFRPIFWWEWGHRFLGRFIGVVWLAGLLVFLAAGRVPRGWTGRLVLPGLLGGVQGAVGWWMVHSGLDKLDVASYRLATHLTLAFAIFALLVWQAMKIRLDEVAALKARRARAGGVMGFAGVVLAAVFLQLVSGALVAGIDAGRGYVDWPLMQGQILPAESFDLVPLWTNFFENAALVQFNHRVIGYALVILALLFTLRASRSALARVRMWGRAVGAVMAAQMAVGIVTVMNAAALEIAIAHQAGALIVIAVVLRARFAAAYPAEQSVRG